MSETLGNIASLAYYGPELGLGGAALSVVIWDLVAKSRRQRVNGAVLLSFIGLTISALYSASFLLGDLAPRLLFAPPAAPEGLPAAARAGLLAFDDYTHTFRILFAVVTGLIILFAAPPMLDDTPNTAGGARRNPSEMLALLLVVTLGLNMLAASHNLLMIYLSLEIVSVMSFVLAGYKLGDRKSSEGALKYVIFGGVASGVMLYGMSWIYGLTGSLDLGQIQAEVMRRTAAGGKVPEAVVVGAICMLAGFGYKISAAPFHMWTPDVYEGAPTAVTAFLSVGPKAAGFAVLVRFFADGLGATGSVAGDPLVPWPVLAGCLAMATMTVGNLSALGQSNVKRMLAYSSIAHAGYMLLGFAVFNQAGTTAIVFYLFAYCFMNLGAFLVVLAVAEVNGGDETFAAFQGLGRRAPLLAAAMTVFMLSLAGLPPMVGFIGKFYLFAALVQVGGGWNWTLAVVGVLNSLVSLFYYARVIRAMYLEHPDAGEAVDVRRLFGATTLVLAVPTLLLGVYWAPLYDWVARSLQMVH